MHQSLQGATFHVEHVVPRSRGGGSKLENLAFSCPGCNLRKAGRVEVADPDSGNLASVFNPRTDRWGDHFRFDGFEIVPLTLIGRATCEALRFNDPRRLQIREAEALFGLFPPLSTGVGS